jgi:hypothetical protein
MDKLDSMSMVDAIHFSALINSNVTSEIIDDQMVDGLVTITLDIGFVVNIISCCGNFKERCMVHR